MSRQIIAIVGTFNLIIFVSLHRFKTWKIVGMDRVLLVGLNNGVITSSSVDVSIWVMDTVAGVKVTILLGHTSILTMRTWVSGGAGAGATP